MKLLTNIIDKVGIDKVLHFAIGALFNAMLYPFGREYTIVGIVAVFMLYQDHIRIFGIELSCHIRGIMLSVL